MAEMEGSQKEQVTEYNKMEDEQSAADDKPGSSNCELDKNTESQEVTTKDARENPVPAAEVESEKTPTSETFAEKSTLEADIQVEDASDDKHQEKACNKKHEDDPESNRGVHIEEHEAEQIKEASIDGQEPDDAECHRHEETPELNGQSPSEGPKLEQSKDSLTESQEYSDKTDFNEVLLTEASSEEVLENGTVNESAPDSVNCKQDTITASSDCIEDENVDCSDGKNAECIDDSNTACTDGQDTDSIAGQNKDCIDGSNTDSIVSQSRDFVDSQNTDCVNGPDTHCIDGQNKDCTNGQNSDCIDSQQTIDSPMDESETQDVNIKSDLPLASEVPDNSPVHTPKESQVEEDTVSGAVDEDEVLPNNADINAERNNTDSSTNLPEVANQSSSEALVASPIDAEGTQDDDSMDIKPPSTSSSSSDISQSGGSSAALANKTVKPKETSSFLGHLKQGIKSATKEASPFREALGQMKQGLRTAISETSSFLEGPSVSRPIPLPVHATSSEPHMHSYSQTQRLTRPRPNTEILQTENHGAVSTSAEGAGDAAVPSDIPEDDLLSELDAELDQEQTVVHETTDNNQRAPPPRPPPPNGVRQIVLTEIPEYKELKATVEHLRKELQEQREKNTRVLSMHEAQDDAILHAKQETEEYKKQLEDFKSNSSEDLYLAEIKALETKITNQQKEINTTQDKLEMHDKAAKEAVAKLQAELKAKVDQLSSVTENAKKDRADMVLKYARAESKNIEMEQRMTKNDAKMKEMIKERESMMSKFKALKADQTKCRELFESRSTEVVQLRRELEKQKELFISQEGKTKWAHNKLRQEIDSHKETRAKLDEAVRKNKVSRDEAEQIRRDCQSMIKCYQESEEIKSNSLDQELKHKETELMQHKQEKIDSQEIHNLTRRELETLKMKHKEIIEELKTWRDKVTCLDAERIIQEQSLNKYRETLQKQKETNQSLESRLAELEDVEKIVLKVEEKNKDVERRNEELELECTELRADMDRCATREQEHLLFTQKISDKNAHLQSENSALSNKVTGLTAENERITSISDDYKSKKESLEKELATEKQQGSKQSEELSKNLEEKIKEVEHLTVEVDDARNEIKTLKRKHAANMKDLMRQLQSSKRRLESLEPKEGGSSMGSRTSSNGSLDTVNGTRSSSSIQPQVEPEPFVEIVEVDKQMLIEKIVRLQKAHARKNEKLEFMEDHIQQLFTEVQKKTKIIQNYALREEAGTISPEAADANKISEEKKALLAKKGGIMASLYTSHQQDGAMTLDLSLDINRKLQAVLEDTLLKNITLKENLDTLGEEIARLSQENRAIQLSQQQAT